MQRRLISVSILVVYVAILIKVMVFKIVPIIKAGQVTLNFGGANGGHPANFVPFATIVPYLLGNNGLTIAFLNIAGNIALLVPLGFLSSVVYRSMTWKKALTFGVVAGLAIETLQTVLNVGIFDIDDVILNALGFVLGYGVFILLIQWVRESKYKYVGIAVCASIAAVACAFYIMYPHGEQPVIPGVDVNSQGDSSSNNQEGVVPQNGDLCNGTGGTGEILSTGNGSITIKGRTGAAQVIALTDQTVIKTSSGSASPSDLHVGDHVTVVILGEARTASMILVCSTPESERSL